MLYDHAIPKPSTATGYALHRMVAGLAGGAPVQYADVGEQILLRSAQRLAPDARELEAFTEGDIVGFELRAAPNVKTRGSHRYFPLQDKPARHDWLRRKAAGRGFEVLTVFCSTARQRIEKPGRSFMMDCTDFAGILRVTDGEAFAEMLSKGIGGPGKAFGYGMMII